MTCQLTRKQIEQTQSFHGHWCPGLATGVRAAEWALAELSGRSGDEELVAIVETDMCGVDAIQFLTGCTFGKGNLIHRDYGKNAFTFYRRSDGKSARLVARPDLFADARKQLGNLHLKMQSGELTREEQDQMARIRSDMIEGIMAAELTKLFQIKGAQCPAPQKARILASLVCEQCGEAVMESRTRRFNEQTLCIPCFRDLENR